MDNNTAIHWVKAGKITPGNQYLDLAYHQVREWERTGYLIALAIHTKDNISDIGSQPCGEDEFAVFYPVLCGREKWVIKLPRITPTGHSSRAGAAHAPAAVPPDVFYAS